MLCLRALVLATLTLAAACSSRPDAPDAGVDAAIVDAPAVDAAALPSGPYDCGDALTCTADEYCQTFLPGACGGTPVDQDGMCPDGCALCPSGAECGCPSYQCLTIPDGCQACACLEPAGGPACTCEAFGADGVFVTCAGA